MRRPCLLGPWARSDMNWTVFVAPTICFALVGIMFYDTKFWMPKRMKRAAERGGELFDAYCKGRLDEVSSDIALARLAFEKWRDEELERLKEHMDRVHPGGIDGLEQIVEGHFPSNVHGAISVVNPDGTRRQPVGLFGSDDVGEATAFWVMSGSVEAWTRLSIAVAAAIAMQESH